MPEQEVDEETKEKTPGVAELVGVGLLKDLTSALIGLNHTVKALIRSMVGTEETKEDSGTPGLLEKMDDVAETMDHLDEATSHLDTHVVGQNLLLSRINFVFDRVLEVHRGNPSADAPVPGRSATLDDVSAALEEFDKKVDEAAEREEKQEAEAAQNEGSLATTISTTSSSMIQDGTIDARAAFTKKGLPPLPQMRPRGKS